jgi:hypothetical protein
LLSTLTTLYYGHKKTVAEDSYTAISADNSRAYVGDRSDDDLWVVSASVVAGRSGGTQPDVRISVYDTDASKNPTSRAGYFALVKPSTSMTGVGGGSLVTAAVEQADNSPSDAAIMIHSGKRYALDVLTKSQGLGVSFHSVAFPTVDNDRFYNRSAPGDPPPATDYSSYTSTSNQGNLTLFLTGYRNNPPEIPVSGLSPSGTVSSTTPTFTADFRDLNGSYGGTHSGVNVGDVLQSYKIQVRQVGGSTLFWNQTFNATPDEQEADAVSRVYSGTALVRGTQYEWRIRVSDQFDAWSDDYSAWTAFTPQALGFVTLDSAPTGKILSNTPSFSGRWNHQAATAMTNVQVRLLSSRGTVLQDTGTKVKAAVSFRVTGHAVHGHVGADGVRRSFVGHELPVHHARLRRDAVERLERGADVQHRRGPAHRRAI